jgi:hypothetical protein
MKSSLILLLTLVTAQAPQIPKNDPTGVWESASGTQYELKLTGGSDLTVRLVPGSNQRYVSYEVDLKVHPEELNTYIGKGFFVAKVKEGKECRFETEWQLTVIQKERIFGGTTNIVPDPDTCAVREKSQVQLSMTKKN